MSKTVKREYDPHIKRQENLKGYPIFLQYKRELMRCRYHKIDDTTVLLMMCDLISADVDNELIGILVRLVVTHNDTMWDAYVEMCKK